MPSDFLAKIVAHKQYEVAAAKTRVAVETLTAKARARTDQRPFAKRLLGNGQECEKRINIIAEIKRASPSKGLFRADLDPARYAAAYEKGGAAALSVLTDEAFFQGSLDDLVKARGTCRLPVLRKDFIISKYQIYEAAAAGADALLLIVRILSPDQLGRYLTLTHALGLEALVEVYAADEIATATAAGARVIGINNRNLETFETDITHAMRVAALLKPGQIAVAASGIGGRKDIEANLKAGVFSFLIGESLVRAADPCAALRFLNGPPGTGDI